MNFRSKNLEFRILVGLISSAAFIVFIGPMQVVSAEEARVYAELENFSSVESGDFTVKLFIDSQVPLNAYQFNFVYPADLMTVQRVSLADSVISVVPESVRTDIPGLISIVGGSPEAFSGTRGLIATVSFLTEAPGQGQIGFSGARVYKADGLGTDITPEAFYIPIQIQSVRKASVVSGEATTTKETAVEVSDNADILPPLITLFKIEKNPFEPENRLLVFDAQDESGIAYYLVQERHWLWFTSEMRAVNPYSIVRGAWAVRLIAVDIFGNETRKTAYILSALLMKLLFLAIVLFAIVFVRIFYRHWHKHRLEEKI